MANGKKKRAVQRRARSGLALTARKLLRIDLKQSSFFITDILKDAFELKFFAAAFDSLSFGLQLALSIPINLLVDIFEAFLNIPTSIPEIINYIIDLSLVLLVYTFMTFMVFTLGVMAVVFGVLAIPTSILKILRGEKL